MRALERPEIGDVGHHHDDAGVASRIGADRARVLAVDIAADAAHLDLLQRRLHGGGERRHDLLAFLDQKQRRAPRRAGTKSWQAGEQLDQALDLGSGSSGRHRTCIQNNFMPGGSGRPPATSFIFSCNSASALRRAAACAATIRSSRISFSAGLIRESSILTLFISPLPESVTLTSPPPDVPSTSSWSSSACIASILDLSSAACFIRPRKSAIQLSFPEPHASPPSPCAPKAEPSSSGRSSGSASSGSPLGSGCGASPLRTSTIS